MLNTTAALFTKVAVRVNENYVGESVRNVVLRWAEHEDPNEQSGSAKHLKYFLDQQFEWKVLTRAPEYTKKRKF